MSLLKVPVTIANSTSLSPAVNVQSTQVSDAGRTLVGIQMPASWTSAAITFQCSTDGGTTFQDVYDSAGAEVSITAVQGHYVNLTQGNFAAFDVIKVRSG